MYTSHGHQISGTSVEEPRPPIARCGGPRICKNCATEAVLYGPEKVTDFIDIGPQCFANAELTIISYKGMNFYRACDTLVAKLVSGGQSFCVKRVDHPGVIHEDFDGRTRDEG